MNISASHSPMNMIDIAAAKRKEAASAGEHIECCATRKESALPATTEPGAGGGGGGSAGGNAGVETGFSYTNRDLQHLMADWGVSGSAYDLNKDGTVNVTDMLTMLSGIGNGARPWTPGNNGDAAKLPMNANTLAHIQVDWGQTDSRYDVTGDGVVNVSDILHVLSNWDSSAGAAPGSVATPDGAIAALPTAPPEPTTPVVVPPADPAATPVSNPSDPVVASAPPATGPLAPAKIKHLTASIIERLNDAGFTKKPPMNIREIIAKLDIQPADRKAIIANLREHYRHGLGVNLRA